MWHLQAPCFDITVITKVHLHKLATPWRVQHCCWGVNRVARLATSVTKATDLICQLENVTKAWVHFTLFVTA